MRTLLRRLAYLVRLGRHTRELDEEMAFHRSLSGSSAFGNTTLAANEGQQRFLRTVISSDPPGLVELNELLRGHKAHAIKKVF